MLNVSRADGGCGLLALLDEGKTASGALPKDIIGLECVEGIQIFRHGSDAGFRVARQTLQQDDIESWIMNTDPTMCNEKLRARILIGDQVLRNDRLRPHDDALAIRFSRSRFAASFQLPLLAIQKIASHSKWQMTFPTNNEGDPVTCDGMGISDMSFAMSQAPTSSYCQSFVVCHTRDARNTFIQSLEHVSGMTFHPTTIKFIVSNTAAQSTASSIHEHQVRAAEVDLHLTRFATQRDASTLFGASHCSAGVLDYIEQDINTNLGFVKRTMVFEENGQYDQAQSEMWNAFSHLSNELGIMLGNVSVARNDCARHLSTSLNMMMFAQQELTRQEQKTSIAIAEASKIIAEETKRDGSSMKTLALVTMFFLPATSISSIFSTTFFNWQAQGDGIVNGKIWIYFTISIPLTALTLLVWWMWQRQLLRQSSPAVVSKA